jgi:hypothetical protein
MSNGSAAPSPVPRPSRLNSAEIGELVRVLEADGEEALVPDRTAKRPGLPVVARNPDRHTRALDPERRLPPVSPASPERVHRRDRLGGLIHEYAVAV